MKTAWRLDNLWYCDVCLERLPSEVLLKVELVMGIAPEVIPVCCICGAPA